MVDKAILKNFRKRKCFNMRNYECCNLQDSVSNDCVSAVQCSVSNRIYEPELLDYNILLFTYLGVECNIQLCTFRVILKSDQGRLHHMNDGANAPWKK